jgi:hypothetical protein
MNEKYAGIKETAKFDEIVTLGAHCTILTKVQISLENKSTEIKLLVI